jgi:hypothetical protein
MNLRHARRGFDQRFRSERGPCRGRARRLFDRLICPKPIREFTGAAGVDAHRVTTNLKMVALSSGPGPPTTPP